MRIECLINVSSHVEVPESNFCFDSDIRTQSLTAEFPTSTATVLTLVSSECAGELTGDPLRRGRRSPLPDDH